MFKSQFIFFLIIGLLITSFNVFPQTSEEDVRAAYIYQFPNYIDWQKNLTQFRIGCITGDEKMIRKLKYISNTRKIGKKSVEFEVVDNLELLTNNSYDILYFDKYEAYKIDQILITIKGKKTLLVTNNAQNKESIMINFLPSEKEGVVRFEVNKKNIVDEGMIVSPDILLLGGSFVDVRALFHEKEQELMEIENKLKQSLKQIEEKQQVIENQDKTIEEKSDIINQRSIEINSLSQKLSYQQLYLDSLVNEINKKQTQIKNSNKLIESQLKAISEHKAEILESKKEIEQTRVELNEQKLLLSGQKDQIASQKMILNDQMTQIQLQRNLILGSIIIVCLILSLVYIIYRGLRQKKKANEILKEVNEEVILQNEEIKSQREEILTARDQLENTNQELERRNEELDNYRLHLEDLVKQRTDDLLIEKEKAEAASKMKTSFIENMSHEIRTPMNAILGFTRLLTTMELSQAAKKEYVNIINSNADSLMRFINDLIDLSNIESGKVYISKSIEDINSLLNELLVVYSEVLKNDDKLEKINLHVKVDDDPLIINTDHFRIKQVFENLLSNAVKYTYAGSIEFGYINNGEAIRFFVKDTGIGIPKDKHQFVFERFNKIETNNTVYRGVGIGLSICKSIVEALDGEIELISELDKGSEFSFTIPFEAAN